MCLGVTRGSIWTTSMELQPQNHNRDGLLGPKFQNGGIYGPPLIRAPARDPSGVFSAQMASSQVHGVGLGFRV